MSWTIKETKPQEGLILYHHTELNVSHWAQMGPEGLEIGLTSMSGGWAYLRALKELIKRAEADFKALNALK